MSKNRLKIREFIKRKLATDDRWAKKALLCLFNRQTEGERIDRTTYKDNQVGFTAFDADILTGMAKHLLKKSFLTEGQLNLVKKKVPKYWNQIYGLCDQDKLAMSMAIQEENV